MSDILNKTITIESVEQTTTATGKTRFKVKSTEPLTYGMWKIKKDGTETRAYQALAQMGLDSAGQTVSIAFKEDEGEYQGKPITYRTIIGMQLGASPTASQPAAASSDLEGRVRVLESQMRTLQAMVRGKDEAQEAAEAFGGEVVTDMSSPVSPDVEAIDINSIPF